MISNHNISQDFRSRFGSEPTLIARAPGRINLIGEHTDYNGGFVLPAAIDFEIKMAARPTQNPHMRLYSVNYDEAYEFDPAGALPLPDSPQWYSYFLAVCEQFLDRGFVVPPLDVVIRGDVPLGAGLSSSAAFEVCVAVLLKEICGADISAKGLALLAQAAEHSRFVGVRCGIMDQFASALGAEAHALLLDCYSLEYERVPLDPAGASIVIINSNKQRELRSSEFNQRRLECEEGLRRINELESEDYPSLRHVPREVFEKHRANLSEKVARRVKHNIDENDRVHAFVEALRRDDFVRCGELLYASHQSLRDDYEVSCPELDAIVEIARESGLAYGCRMTGGGFGGCAVALVAPHQAEDFSRQMKQQYAEKTALTADVYVSSPAAGADILELKTV